MQTEKITVRNITDVFAREDFKSWHKHFLHSRLHNEREIEAVLRFLSTDNTLGIIATDLRLNFEKITDFVRYGLTKNRGVDGDLVKSAAQLNSLTPEQKQDKERVRQSVMELYAQDKGYEIVIDPSYMLSATNGHAKPKATTQSQPFLDIKSVDFTSEDFKQWLQRQVPERVTADAIYLLLTTEKSTHEIRADLDLPLETGMRPMMGQALHNHLKVPETLISKNGNLKLKDYNLSGIRESVAGRYLVAPAAFVEQKPAQIEAPVSQNGDAKPAVTTPQPNVINVGRIMPVPAIQDVKKPVPQTEGTINSNPVFDEKAIAWIGKHFRSSGQKKFDAVVAFLTTDKSVIEIGKDTGYGLVIRSVLRSAFAKNFALPEHLFAEGQTSFHDRNKAQLIQLIQEQYTRSLENGAQVEGFNIVKRKKVVDQIPVAAATPAASVIPSTPAAVSAENPANLAKLDEAELFILKNMLELEGEKGIFHTISERYSEFRGKPYTKDWVKTVAKAADDKIHRACFDLPEFQTWFNNRFKQEEASLRAACVGFLVRDKSLREVGQTYCLNHPNEDVSGILHRKFDLFKDLNWADAKDLMIEKKKHDVRKALMDRYLAAKDIGLDFMIQKLTGIVVIKTHAAQIIDLEPASITAAEPDNNEVSYDVIVIDKPVSPVTSVAAEPEIIAVTPTPVAEIKSEPAAPEAPQPAPVSMIVVATPEPLPLRKAEMLQEQPASKPTLNALSAPFLKSFLVCFREAATQTSKFNAHDVLITSEPRLREAIIELTAWDPGGVVEVILNNETIPQRQQKVSEAFDDAAQNVIIVRDTKVQPERCVVITGRNDILQMSREL